MLFHHISDVLKHLNSIFSVPSHHQILQIEALESRFFYSSLTSIYFLNSASLSRSSELPVSSPIIRILNRLAKRDAYDTEDIPAILAIPDTLFFLPAFPFSDYCLKHRKAQFVEYQPEES